MNLIKGDNMKDKKLGRPLTDPSEGRRERFAAMVAPSTLKFIKSHMRDSDKGIGHVLDRLLKERIENDR